MNYEGRSKSGFSIFQFIKQPAGDDLLDDLINRGAIVGEEANAQAFAANELFFKNDADSSAAQPPIRVQFSFQLNDALVSITELFDGRPQLSSWLRRKRADEIMHLPAQDDFGFHAENPLSSSSTV